MFIVFIKLCVSISSNYLVAEHEDNARLCDLVVRVSGYTTEMYCDSCEVRTEFIYVM
jgi:hypothetical protein